MKYLIALAISALSLPALAQTLDVEEVEGGYTNLVFVTHAGDGTDRLFLVEQSGKIWVREKGVTLPTPFLNITVTCCGERGLLGLAFDPDYKNNGYFYVNYTTTVLGQLQSRLCSFKVSADPNRADASSEALLLSYDQPAANHNAGWLGFGPDGYLYMAVGDGGSGGDPWGEGGNGQNRSTILGNMLRLGVDGNKPYTIPTDNPFFGMQNVREEIWAYGLRNPWRNSFDRQTGDLYIADVGQNAVEEVNFQAAASIGGENYGWRVMEGDNCFDGSQTGGNPPCNDPGFTGPIHTYGHTGGRCSITGGYVYRGEAMPRSAGLYFFADYCSHDVYSLRYRDGLGLTDFSDRTAELDPFSNITSFGEDEHGELYIVTQQTLYRIYEPAAREVRDAVLPDFATAAGGDNSASLQALQNAGVQITQEVFNDLDADDNGELTLAELLNAAGIGQLHHADTNLDNAISLTELLRVIQLYNANGYTCADGPSEDGFAIGTAPLDCVRHTADYLAPYGRIGLSEVLRMIQFYNTAGFAWCPESGTDDGFCPQA